MYKAVNDLFTPGCQEDAHEYLQSLLDRLDSAYDDTLPNKNKQRKFVNPTKLMEGAIKTDIMCGGCRRHSFTEEPFYCLSLSAEDTTSLEESLVILSHDELMQGNDKYFCVECQNKKVSKKRMTISRLPPTLIIHLKRFCVSKYSSQHKQVTMHKISQHIQFPEVLDFGEKSPYIHEDDLNRIENGDRKYELYAILVHSGPQVGYGHYYALVKSPSGDWFKMNDSQVLPIPIKRVLKEQAYLLFYRRTTHVEMDYRLAALTGVEADAIAMRQHLNSENESKSARATEDEESSSSSHTSNSANETGIREDLITQNYFEESECKRPSTDTSGSVEVVPKKILHHIDTADGIDEYQMVGMPSSTSS
ncbi:hypothetical protein RFI_09196 [Reticulomyxa filosa]|uniref:ubiquitinyl hydrolase 1 n=1 Tax=Reticulomyxa filosa TaxID=46433 RepID=X6NPL1_RETFI|nr:hypothetical protein RFI_09196 [Reticulomyxa filosa]|eukprot:ETO27931.1 hypothetical protein RFI_09196 [Reticulomyxa filosa]